MKLSHHVARQRLSMLITLALATPAVAAIPQVAFAATAAQSTTFNIQAGPLSQALMEYGRQSGLQVSYRPELTAGKSTRGLKEQATSEAALATLLQGSNLNWHYADPNTIILSAAPDSASLGEDNSLQLDTITVSATAGVNPVEAPYLTAAPTAHISASDIEHFRGSSPADIFRGTPGVASGESRNGAGSIDLNIRGMQGMGRVQTTVDGAENSSQVYQGYQGISNRTFVDPDLLAGIDITKGSDVSSGGIAGSVSMRTLNPSDIIKEGNTFGFRLKGGGGGNTTSPHAGDKAGYRIVNNPGVNAAPSSAIASDDTMGRPNLLKPTQGSVSMVAATKGEQFELLGGYAYRNRGNYYAGKNGDSARIVDTGTKPYCISNGTCYPHLAYNNYLENHGSTIYRAGEEVLNTQLRTESWLAKGIYRFGDGQRLQLGYTHYNSEAGELMASQRASNTTQETQQNKTTGTRVNSATLGYSVKPSNNALVNLDTHLWMTHLQLRNPVNDFSYTYGDERTGSNTQSWGGDATNKSQWITDYGSFGLTYGGTWKEENTRPTAYTREVGGWLNHRDAKRKEGALFTKAEYQPSDWLIVNTGLRYGHYWSHDRDPAEESSKSRNSRPERSEGGFSPSVGLTFIPQENTQLFINYSNVQRFPSLFESVAAFTIIPNPDIEPERASNWELGVNYHNTGLFSDQDKAMTKLSYFNWTVKNYISRSYRTFVDPDLTWTGMQVHNIDRAKFSGLEWSSRYEYSGFTAELAANYYLDVQFCQKQGGCESKSMYGDYATNQVPPKYQVNLTLSQALLDDKLTVGSRVSYTGKRAIGHGRVTDQGMSQFISQVKWTPHTLIDLYADYKVNSYLTASMTLENLTDRYYVDPLSVSNVPGPGRTLYGSLSVSW